MSTEFEVSSVMADDMMMMMMMVTIDEIPWQQP